MKKLSCKNTAGMWKHVSATSKHKKACPFFMLMYPGTCDNLKVKAGCFIEGIYISRISGRVYKSQKVKK